MRRRLSRLSTVGPCCLEFLNGFVADACVIQHDFGQVRQPRQMDDACVGDASLVQVQGLEAAHPGNARHPGVAEIVVRQDPLLQVRQSLPGRQTIE